MSDSAVDESRTGLEVAVVGMAGRFPGAATLEEFWRNLRDGVESITSYSREEQLAAGVAPAMLDHPQFVNAGATIEGVELFDAGFFGFSHREAELMDPQHRIFLECAWEALEHAGYDAAQYEGSIGVFASESMNTYLLFNLSTNRELIESESALQGLIRIGNGSDTLPTVVSYKMNLQGPSLNVQSACSSSLAGVHLACRSLLSGECDMALAGGVSVTLPQKVGYLYQEGGTFSPDGRCRAFDARAQGTIFSNGAGVVVLKRLEDALADGDTVHAVIKGSAVNNDGAAKVSFTAPRADGQAAVIRAAQLMAEVSPDSISYVEAHGTGTPLGDPIEIAALTKAFRAATDRRQFCPIGSVKTNVGHLDAAAGVAGLIKTVLALKHRELPPSLHFERPNPRIDFDSSPFFVNAERRAWEPPAAGVPRRAGVSSFGVGGTNVHLIVEEAPAPEEPEAEGGDDERPWQLLVLSARGRHSLEEAAGNLARWLRRDDRAGASLADVAYTLQVGRHAMRRRLAVVCRDEAEAAALLEHSVGEGVWAGEAEAGGARGVAFMFPGQGAQHAGMAAEVYEREPVFRREVERCCELLRPRLGLDLRELMYAPPGDERAEGALAQTRLTQPALFVTEYALARLWMSWGVKPEAMIGHSVGEYVAACLAGVFTLEDALKLVARRGELMQGLEGGAMLAVGLAEHEVEGLLTGRAEVAAVNGPRMCVVSGPEADVAEVERRLAATGAQGRRLRTSHAFHSSMMDGILDEFREEVRRVKLEAPRVAYVSNVTGRWVGAAEATDPDYWVRQLRHTVRFSDGLRELKGGNYVLLEVGPGQTLGTLARLQHDEDEGAPAAPVLSSLPNAADRGSSAKHLLTTLARLWVTGVEPAWSEFHGRPRRRVPLPTYPFERQRYWVEAGKGGRADVAALTPSGRNHDLSDWFYLPSWKRSLAPASDETTGAGDGSPYLIFADACGVGARLAERLRSRGQEVVVVTPGEEFARAADSLYTLAPGRRADYDLLFQELRAEGRLPRTLLHLWNLTGKQSRPLNAATFDEAQARGFYSLLFIAQALADQGGTAPLHLNVVSDNMQKVAGETALCPEKATLLGPCKVIPQEFPHVNCRSIDLRLDGAGSLRRESLVEQLLAETTATTATTEAVVAYRGHDRWVQSFEAVRVEKGAASRTPLKERGVYLITGGLGGLGLVFARHLALRARARLVLTGRTPLPDRSDWERWLEEHPAANAVGDRIREVLKLEEAGAEVLVATADAADAEQMRKVVALCRERFGRIDGVVHAAGLPGVGVIPLKTVEAAAAVLAPKVKGALILDELLRDAEPDFFIYFSSVASVLGGLGQVDYCAANAFLDAFAAHQVEARGSFALSVNWDGWVEVGMAAAAELPPELRGAGRRLVKEIEHPLLDACVQETPARAVYATELNVAKDWILSEHKVAGSAVIPGTTYLEIIRAAFEQHLGRAAVVELRQVLFLSPLSVQDGETREVHTILERDGEAFNVRVVSRPASGDEDEWQEHARGSVRELTGEPRPEHSPERIARRTQLSEVEVAAGDREGRDQLLELGRRWHNLQRVWVGRGEGLALLELPAEFRGDLKEMKLHPPLLDVACGFLSLTMKERYLPVAFEAVRVNAPLPERVYSHITFDENGAAAPEVLSCDVRLLDEEGLELVVIEGFTAKRVNDAAALQSSLRREPAPASQAAARRGVRRGIFNEEGVDAFERVLGRGLRPQVVVSPVNFDALIEEARALTSERVLDELEKHQLVRQAHPRPDLQTPYVAPTTEAESTLAGIWQQLLGLERVGVHDNFFDLGGHSLLATQLVSRAREAFRVELPLRSVFEAATVAAMARAVERAQTSESAPEAPPVRPAKRDGELPLSFAQQRLWFLDQLDPGASVQNFFGAFRLAGPLDVATLEAGLNEIIRRHEVLRTNFLNVGGDPVLFIHPERPQRLDVFDLRALPSAQRASEARRRAGEEVRLPFDLQRDPLLRVRLMRLADEEHVLVLVMHHIISDGWSTGVFARELTTLYAAFAAGRPSPLPALQIQYVDFAVWQREWLSGSVLAEQIDYWRGRMAGAPAVLELPFDRPRPPMQSFRGATERFTLPAELSRSLQALCREEDVTPFMLLLAAFQVLLMRYTGQEEVVVGTPIAGRTRAETEELIGLFVNTLVLRTDLSGDPTFREVLGRVKEAALGAYAHQDLPFELLVEALQPVRSLSHAPIFQVAFILQNAMGEVLELPNLSMHSFEVEGGVSRVDLTLELYERADGIGGWFEYNSDLFERATVKRLVRHFRTLLEAVTAGVTQKVSHLPLLPEDERQRIIGEAGPPATPVPAQPAHRLFEAQAARSPDDIAVSFEGAHLTYAELNARADALAARLRRASVRAEERVGLFVERSLEMVVALLGVLKSGGAYVPLDIDMPAPRLARMIEDAGIRLFVTQRSLSERLEVGGAAAAPKLYVDEPDETDGAGAPTADQDWPEEWMERLAYVIYTSGSTGQPKGVAIPHRALSNLLLSMQHRPGLAPQQPLLALTPLSFDIATLELLLPLLSGSTLVVVPRRTSSDPTALASAIAAAGPCVVQATPATWRMLADSGWTGPEVTALCGGEALESALAASLLGRVGALWNMYGPTETTIWSSVAEVGAREVERGAIVELGTAIGNTQLYVLDAGLRPVPQGVVGELCIGGAGLARGYLNRPALTARAFVPDPFSASPGARLYRTGDLARRGADGALEYVGRRDGQVKLRGHRIELGEIEAAVRAQGSVADCAAVVRGAGSDASLVCFVVWRGEEGEWERALREAARERLPEYMIPSTFVEIERLPLTPHGKVDRRALPDVALTPFRPVYEEPQTELERVVAGAWAEVLGAERVGRAENFFESGGHSLLAARLAGRLSALGGVEVGVREVFERPTVAGLAELIESSLGGGELRRLPAIKHVPRDEDLPLSFAQQRLWFLAQLERHGASYNLPSAVRIGGPLDVDVLERALDEVIRRHESLRTGFTNGDGQPLQLIRPEVKLGLPVVDLSAWPETEREAEVLRLVGEDARQPFDLERDVLLRTRLLRLSAKEHVLSFVMHHIISDGWSINIFVGELKTLYAAFDAGHESPLAELPVQYADFAAWQREWLQGERLERQLVYWREHLAGAPPALELPTDRPRSALQSGAGSRYRFGLDERLTDGLRQVCRREGATLFMGLLAGWSALLARYSGQEEVVVGTPVAGRVRPEVEGLIGFFVNTLALRVAVRGDEGFGELLGRVRGVALGGYAHQELPFERVVEELNVERDLSRTPIFQVALSLQPAEGGSDAESGLSLRPFEVETGAARFDLTLFVSEAQGGLRCELEYATSLFEEATVRRLAEHFARLLEAAVGEPWRALAELPLLSETERAAALNVWVGPRQDLFAGNVAGLLEERAQEAWDEVAVVGEGEEVTHAELWRRARRLAARLRARGVGAESRVGLYLERGVGMVVGVLGVLRAGGAYVPLEPGQPLERLKYMVQDSGAALVLTQAVLSEEVRGWGVEPLVIDEEGDGAEAFASAGQTLEDAWRDEVSGENIAYVIYTSGSTGQPKGVAIPHRALSNLLLSMQHRPGLAPQQPLLALTPLSFDIATLELLLPLLSGSTLVVVPRRTSSDPAALAAAIASAAPCVVQATPATWRMLADSGWTGPEVTALCGGEALESALARELLARAGGGLWNMYGPTETTIWSSVAEVGAREVERGAIVELGTAIGNTQLYVLDAGLRPVPQGVVGELCIGGAGLARGYLNRPALTARAFVPDPFSASPGARLYRTGDLARRGADGALEYVGRRDGQVKLRGHRIELGEIEAAVRAQGSVADCAAVVRGAGTDASLVCFVVWRGEEGEWERALREAARERLPEYMRPSRYLRMERLPLTPHGKVDRARLAREPLPPSAAASEGEPPSTPIEIEVARIWQEALGVERVMADDNFFEIGGHSLALARVYRRLEALFGIEVPLAELFEYPTVRAIAEHLTRTYNVDADRVHEQRAREEGTGGVTPRKRKAGARPAALRDEGVTDP